MRRKEVMRTTKEWSTALLYSAMILAMPASHAANDNPIKIEGDILKVVPLSLTDAHWVITSQGSFLISEQAGVGMNADMINLADGVNLTHSMREVVRQEEGDRERIRQHIARLSSASGAGTSLVMASPETPTAVYSSTEAAAKGRADDRSDAKDASVPEMSKPSVKATAQVKLPEVSDVVPKSIPSIEVDLSGADVVVQNAHALMKLADEGPEITTPSHASAQASMAVEVAKGHNKKTEQSTQDDSADTDQASRFRVEIARIHNQLLRDDMTIIYPEKGELKHVITVFTDITCPYCRAFHKEIPELNENGVRVRYLPYPRSGLDGVVARQMAAAYCSEKPQSAFDEALRYGRYPFEDKISCDPTFQYGYRIGQILELPGTPTLITDRGDYWPGKRSAKELIQLLETPH